MFYSEVSQRVVYVRDDPENGFYIWGECTEGGPVTAVDLCQVLLEYAMTCAALGDISQAYCNMEAFGRHLGEALAKHIKDSIAAGTVANLVAHTMQCILKAADAHFTVEQVGVELRYVLDHCPLCATAERTGLRGEVELGHHGLNALCQSLMGNIDPDLIVRAPAESHADQVFFSMVTPSLA
jgi:hypothetical protein